MCLLAFSICDWNWNTIWTAISAVGTCVATIGAIVATLYASRNFKLLQTQIKEIRDKENEKEVRKNSKLNKLDDFFHNENNKELHIINLRVVNTRLKGRSDFEHQGDLSFIINNNIVYNENVNLKINGISVPIGYHIAEYLSNNCICIKIIDNSSGDQMKIYIFKNNNIFKEQDSYFDIIINNLKGIKE